MAGRICTSLAAMCISHEAKPRRAPFAVGPFEPGRLSASPAPSASGKPAYYCRRCWWLTTSAGLVACMCTTIGAMVVRQGRRRIYIKS